METKQSNNSASLADAVKIAGINQRALFNLEWENDTVFKKRELNYKTKAAFQKDLEAGKISKYTTVFIKDTKEIYKNGQYYGSKLDNFNIANESLSNLFVYLIKKVTEDELSTIDELIKDLPYKKIGEDKIFNGKVCISSEENSTIDASVLIKYIDRDNFRIEWNSSAYNVAIYSLFGWIQYVLQVSGGKISINEFNSIGFTPSVSSKNISIVSYDMFNTEEGIQVILTKSGDGTKFLSDNGTYKEISSSDVIDISDIIDRLTKINDGGKVEQNDYDNLKKYMLEGKILVCNSSADGNGISCNVLYYYDGNDIAISINIPYGIMGILYSGFFISGSNLSISKPESVVPFIEHIPECNLSKEYKKPDSYTTITSSDSIERAIGKLEASVSSEDFVLDLSKYDITYGTAFNLTEEDLSGIKNSVNNKKKVLIKLGEVDGGGLYPISSSINEDGVITNQYKCKIEYFVFEDTVTVNISTKTNECIILYSRTGIASGSSKDISISTSIQGLGGEQDFDSSILLLKSGNGTKYLSDNGEYKEIQIQENVINISDLLEKISSVDDGGKIEQNDYNILVGYLEKGKILIATNEFASSNINYSYTKDNFINLSYQFQYGEIILVNSFFINNDLTIKKYEQLIPSGSGDGSKFLSNDGKYKEAGIPDAPDENLYVRKKNEWARINIPEVQSDIVFIDIDFMSYSYPSDGNSIDLTPEQYNKISEAIDKKKIFRINAICGTFFGYANLKLVSEQQEENPIKYQILISSLDSNSVPGTTDINKYENLLLSITEYNGEYKATFALCKDKVIIVDGNGSLFLSNDGTYKPVIDTKLSGYSKVSYNEITENDTIKNAIGKLEYKVNDITNYVTISDNICYLRESSTQEEVLEALRPNISDFRDFRYKIRNNEKFRIESESLGRYSDLLLSTYDVGGDGYSIIMITGMFIDSTTFDSFLATLKIKFKGEELLKLEFSKL